MTDAQCRTLAGLARLCLDAGEVARLSPQLDQILGYIEQLQAVDVDAVPEYASPQAQVRLRPDEPGGTLGPARVVSSAAENRGDLIAVPKFKDD